MQEYPHRYAAGASAGEEGEIAVSSARLPGLSCDVVGTLDRVDRVAQFTECHVGARLVVPAGTNVEQAERLMAKAEQGCLITNSLKATSHLEATVAVA